MWHLVGDSNACREEHDSAVGLERFMAIRPFHVSFCDHWAGPGSFCFPVERISEACAAPNDERHGCGLRRKDVLPGHWKTLLGGQVRGLVAPG